MTDRLDRCLGAMEDAGVDVLFLGRESNARFVSGAERLWLAGTRPFAPSCVVVRSTRAVHSLSNTDVGFPHGWSRAQLYPTSWNPVTIMGSVAEIEGVGAAGRIGVDGLTPMWEQLIGAALPNVELVDGEAVMRVARRSKTATDLDGIGSAIGLTQRAFESAIDALRPGITERELVGVFGEEMAHLGVSTPAFEGTFCVVDDGSPIRRLTTDRVLADGDLVAMSAGALLGGWEGSLARTWPCGRPTTAQADRWSRWHDRWTDLVDACAAGARVGDLRGREGVRVHGVGLGYEDTPDDDHLEAGMVVALELTAHGILGQDLFLLTAAGREILTTCVYPTFSA